MPEDMSGFDKAGRVWFRSALSAAELSHLDQIVDLTESPGQRVPMAQVRPALYGLTNLIQTFDRRMQPVRFVAFNKGEARNWSLPWHQDRVIAAVNTFFRDR